MQRVRFSLWIALVCGLWLAVTSPAFAQGISGDAKGAWMTEDDKSKVEVGDCGTPGGTGLCAKIIWLKDPNDAKGRPLTDGNNENASLHKRPILGLPLFEGMKPKSTGTWTGRIYNPEDGGTFDVTVWLASANRLVIKGCVLFVCETHAWTRAP